MTAGSIVVLYTNGRPLPANAEFDSGMMEVLSERKDLQVAITAEFLDFPSFSGEAYERTVAEFLRAKYAGRQPTLVVAGGDRALAFALRHREQMFPGVPLLHAAVDTDKLLALGPMPEGVYGVPTRYDFAGSVEQALRWRPQARRLLVLTGATAWDKEWHRRMEGEARQFDGRLAVQFESVDSTEAMLQRLAKLGDDWLVFTPGYFRDGQGRSFTPRETARLIATAAPVPVLGPFSTFMGTGILGGYMPRYADMGRVTARFAARVVGSEAPASIELPAAMPLTLHVDWRQAQRFGIGTKALPADTVVQFREPSFWEEHRALALGGAAVIVLQAGLISALLVERRRRRHAASALALSEQRMSLAAQAARLSMWIWDFGHRQAWVRTPSRRSTDGDDPQFSDFKQALALVHPQDRGAVEAAFAEASQSGEALDVEYRVTSADGKTRWMAARGRVASGGPKRLLGVALDITARKQAELQAEQDRAALRHMTRVSLLGQLSASIAHQLNQPLAAILSNAEAAQVMLAVEDADLDELRAVCADIVSEDQRAAAIIRRLGSLFQRGEPTLAPLDVNELVRDTLELLRTNLLTRQVTVVTRLAADLPALHGDRVQLQQLLLNLIVNAADAMASLPAERRRIVLSTELLGSDLRLCVADNGPGLSADDMHKVFEPFWSGKAQGMGIGLAIGRSIAEAHRGSLVASNRPEGGAQFCAKLPVPVSAATEPIPAAT